MATFDVSPLFRPTSLSFDRVWNQLNTAVQLDNSGFPNYDILRIDDEAFRISLAVPGFSQKEIAIETRDGAIWIKGQRELDLQHNQYLYQGIEKQEFRRSFQLPEHVKVRSARLEAGMLHIDLYRDLPESLRPHRIEIVSEETARPVLEDASRAA